MYTLSESKHFFIKETVGKSIISDTYSIFTLGLLFWFNYNFIGWSYFVNFLIFVAILLKLTASMKKIHRFKTKEQLMKFLEENDPEE